jgi:hypothetical protein
MLPATRRAEAEHQLSERWIGVIEVRIIKSNKPVRQAAAMGVISAPAEGLPGRGNAVLSGQQALVR